MCFPLPLLPPFALEHLFARLFLLEDADLGMFDRAHTCTVPDRYLWLSYSALYEVYADPVDVGEVSADYHWAHHVAHELL